MEWIWFRVDRMVGDGIWYGRLEMNRYGVLPDTLLVCYPPSLPPFFLCVPILSTLSLSLRFGCHIPWCFFFFLFRILCMYLHKLLTTLCCFYPIEEVC